MRGHHSLAKVTLWLIAAQAAATLFFSCDAWNGGNVGIGQPPPAPQTWSGVVQFGTAAADSSQAVAVDSSGNVYVASLDDQFVVVRKYAQTGSLLWVSAPVTIGTLGSGLVSGIALSPTAVYVTGFTSVAVDGGLMSAARDGFVLKYSTSGVKVGALQIRGAGFVRGIAADTSDNIYAGWDDGSQSFVVKYAWSGSSPLQSDNVWITPGVGPAIFGLALGNGLVHVASLTGTPPTADFSISRFSTVTGLQSGSTITGGGPGNTSVFAVAADALNNTYVAGGTDNNFGGVNAGVGDVIAAKYDAAGNNVWRYQIGSARNETANSIALSGTSVYVAGTTGAQFGGQLNKDPGLSTSDAFLIKLPNASAGPTVTADWVRMYGSTNGLSVSFSDQASGVAVDPSGNIFMVGNAVGFMETSTQILGAGDGYVMKISPAGVLQ